MEAMEKRSAREKPSAQVLVVDDHPANLMAMEAVLSPLGVPVVFARSGEEALHRLLDDDFAVVLLDVVMPGMTGLEVARLMRARDRTRNVPIIFLTARDPDERDIVQGYLHRAADYLSKPFNPSVLRAKVSVFVELHKAREAARQLAREEERRARAESDRQRFHALLMRAPVAVVVLAGADYVFELANERFCKLSNRDVPAGKKLAEVFPELAGSPVMDLLKEAYEKAEPFAASEFPVLLDRNRDGALVQAYFDFNIEPLHGDDGALRLMASALDVTDHVNARRVRDDFLSIASHELKTPLTTLRLQGDALQRLVDKRRCSEETIAPKIVVMRRQIDRLGRLVKELLDVSSIAAGKLPLTIEEVDLSQLAHELVDRYRVELGAARCEVKLLADAPVVGQWDRLRLDQVLTNLLTNAMKYGRGRPIEIATESVDATNARLTVRDSGVGIAPEHQERIFQRFERAVTDRNFGGLGLGLWIVAQIVKDSGGQVRVESALGEGALFVVDLPKGAQRCGS